MVTAELDAGQVLAQALLAIKAEETAEALQARVQKLEHQIRLGLFTDCSRRIGS